MANLPRSVAWRNPCRLSLRAAAFTLAATLAIPGCSLVRQPEPSPEPEALPEAPEYVFEHDTVWTATPGVLIRGDSAITEVPRVFTALPVVDADSAAVIVRCEVCEGTPIGRVPHADVVHTAAEPPLAATGTLAEFALSVRRAAADGDIDGLAAVMARDFTFSMVGLQGSERAIEAWRSDGFQILTEIPALLDGGLTAMPGGVWAAPVVYAERPGFQGLRIGFRRSPGGNWEWVFLIRGLAANAR